MLVKNEFMVPGFRFSLNEFGVEMAHAYLYTRPNDGHNRPAGYVEDVFVEEAYRGKGYEEQIVDAVIAEARKQRCHTLVANPGDPSLEKLYARLGFTKRGIECRMDF